ncbi:MAG: hypothetical protein ACYTJ0_11540 [Planctomycetota bacterium]|jgi:hypothetical protein
MALLVAWRFPLSFRPESWFLLLRRYFRSAEHLLSAASSDAARRTSPLGRWRRAFHVHEISLLPRSCKGGAGCCRPRRSALHALLEVRSAREPGHRAQELLEDMGAWRPGVPEAFARLASDPGAVDPAALCSSRETLLAQLEARVAQGFGQAGEPSVPVEEGEHLYRLLSASRGLSRALVGVVERLAPIEWARLREARF